MAANALRFSVLETFRSVWVCGRLDYQRAAEVLEGATRAAEGARAAAGASPDDEEIRRAQQNVETARRRLAEVEAALGAQFDRFCHSDR
jgi:hypothetical protein